MKPTAVHREIPSVPKPSQKPTAREQDLGGFALENIDDILTNENSTFRAGRAGGRLIGYILEDLEKARCHRNVAQAYYQRLLVHARQNKDRALCLALPKLQGKLKSLPLPKDSDSAQPTVGT